MDSLCVEEEKEGRFVDELWCKLIVFILIILMILGTYYMSDDLKIFVLYCLLSGHIMQDLADKRRKK